MVQYSTAVMKIQPALLSGDYAIICADRPHLGANTQAAAGCACRWNATESQDTMSKSHTSGTAETPPTSWPRHGLRSWWRWCAAALIFAGAAGAAAWWQVARTERLLRTEFLLHARLAASSFEAGVMAAVPFASGAGALPEFQQLHRQMRHLAAAFRADWKPRGSTSASTVCAGATGTSCSGRRAFQSTIGMRRRPARCTRTRRRD